MSRSWYSVSGIFLSDAKLILSCRIPWRDRRTWAQCVKNHTINFNAILGPCTTAYLVHKHHMDSPRDEPLPGGSHSSSGNVPLPSVFCHWCHQYAMCVVSLWLTWSNTLVGYYPKKEFQALNDGINASLLQQGFIGCTLVQLQLAVAMNLFNFYTAACRVHLSFSIEAFTRMLCLVHQVSLFLH